jgi:septum formation protein
MDKTSPEIVLASGSPRRRELMALLGLPFRVQVANVDETGAHAELPTTLVRRLSRDKGWAVAHSLARGFVIAADTIVVLDDAILGKPANVAEASAMLTALRGCPHRVLSSITIIRQPEEQELTECVESTVTMRAYPDEELAAYVATGDPLDKAGAYAIQHRDFRPAASIEGCYASVMGFPLCHVYRALRQLGVVCVRRPVAGCEAITGRPCAYYTAVLPPGDSSAEPKWNELGRVL